MLEQSGRVPGGEFRVGEIRNLLADTRLRIVGGEREVEQDAPHALALELERAALVGAVELLQRRRALVDRWRGAASNSTAHRPLRDVVRPQRRHAQSIATATPAEHASADTSSWRPANQASDEWCLANDGVHVDSRARPGDRCVTRRGWSIIYSCHESIKKRIFFQPAEDLRRRATGGRNDPDGLALSGGDAARRGLFPSLEKRYRWRLFSFLPPIVLTYLLVTALAVGGLWSPTAEIQAAQRALTTQLLPALLFLLMVTCDLRAILARRSARAGGVRLRHGEHPDRDRHRVPAVPQRAAADGWKMLAALSATWTGGSANLVAVKQVIGLSESSLPPVLLADALCYSVWVLRAVLDRRVRAGVQSLDARRRSAAYPELRGRRRREARDPAASVLLWLGLALLVGSARRSWRARCRYRRC